MKDADVIKAFNKAEKKKLVKMAADVFNAFYREGEDEYNPDKELNTGDLIEEICTAFTELGVLPVKRYKVSVHRKQIKSGTLEISAFDKKDAMDAVMELVVTNDADEDLENVETSYEKPEVVDAEEA